MRQYRRRLFNVAYKFVGRHDEAPPSLGRVDFFNYGEPFLHKRAVEMCQHIKSHHPHTYLHTSTNGLAFNEA